MAAWVAIYVPLPFSAIRQREMHPATGILYAGPPPHPFRGSHKGWREGRARHLNVSRKQ